jgi:TonB-linked SusC/RagA family outer membrane protein
MKKMILLLLSCWIAGTAWTQNRQISGVVLISETGKPLSGASVQVKGTSQGTATDADGKFSLNFTGKGKPVLVISFTGFATQEVTAGGSGAITVKLADASRQLSDAVVIGYGTVKRKDLTGAVGSIGSADLVRANPSDVTQAIQGQVPGVVVTKGSNQPGQTFAIDIRGEGTITGQTEPLYVIDGVVGGRLRDVNPADIQSIDILKDASSTAIYGSRGANGVVIVTSKKGSASRLRVTVDSYTGDKVPAHLLKLQNAQQFYKMTATDYAANGGSPATFTVNEMNNINNGKSTDWVKLMNHAALRAGTTVAVSGGNGGTTYYFSGGYTQDNGSELHTSFKRYNLNASVDSKITKFLRVGFTAYLAYSTNPTGSLEALRSAYRARPTGTPYYKDLVNPGAGYDLAIGPYNGYAVWMGINDNQVLNPLVEADPANTQEQVNGANQMGNAFAEVKLLKGLTFRSSISATNLDNRTGDYRGTLSKDRAAVNPPRATYSTADNTSYTLDNQLTYQYTKGKSHLTVTALQEAYKNTAQTYSIAVQNLPYASIWYNLGTAGNANVTGVTSSYVQNTLESFMGRINYNYDDKYLLTLTGRNDGASQLAAGNKWAFFPSGAFAWHASEEEFIKQLDWLSDLKLRVSYGQVGNANVAPYATQANVLSTIYSFDQTLGGGFAPGNLGNSNLKWERSQEFNIGLNMGFLQNRVVVVGELYKKTTKDLILQENLPTTTGFNSVYANVGQISNKGVEIAVTTRNVVTENFSWTTSVNFAKNINRIDKLANGVNQIIGNSLFVGKSVKSYYDYKFAGIWQVSDSAQAKSYNQSPGSVRVVDKNHDGVISSATGADDRQVLGTQLPNYTMGMTNYFHYKAFDLSALLYYRNGTLYNNAVLTGTMGDFTNTRYNHIVMNYWTRSNPTNKWYAPGVSQPYKSAIQYEKASFLRVSDITFGYTMPKRVLDKRGVERLRFYIQVTNPFVVSKYHGLDPEYNSATYIDQVPTVVYTFGFNLGF